jgi:hypothetical protein
MLERSSTAVCRQCLSCAAAFADLPLRILRTLVPGASSAVARYVRKLCFSVLDAMNVPRWLTWWCCITRRHSACAPAAYWCSIIARPALRASLTNTAAVGCNRCFHCLLLLLLLLLLQLLHLLLQLLQPTA